MLVSISVFLIAFLITFISGFVIIPFLRRLKFGQTILDIGPVWHKSKEGTPTMGGVMMVIGALTAFAVGVSMSLLSKNGLSAEFSNKKSLTFIVGGLFLALAMGSIGFLDDYIKVVKKRNLGLTAKQKTALQMLVSVMYLVILCIGGMHTTNIPLIGDINIISGWGLLFWPIAVMFIYGFTNAVNLTDGVDGLASSVTLVVASAMIVLSYLLNHIGINIYACAIAGACGGFIIWNAKPAKVFMGDTGSMFLGGAVVALAFGTDRPVILILCGVMYFLEALSVIVQVTYFKKTGKRVFKMTPIHHHFEMSGWSEQKIVVVFSFVACIGCVLALLPILLTTY